MRLLAPLALALIVAAAVGWAALADDAAVKSAPMSRGWVFGELGGADLFGNVCAACHQPDAKGARTKGGQWWLGHSDERGSTSSRAWPPSP